MRVERLTAATQADALRYLRRSPYTNVFITHVLQHDRRSGARGEVAIAIGAAGVAGVAHCGRQLVLAAEPEAVPSLAEYAKRHRGERMIVGARDTVRAFWSVAQRWHAPPRLVRDRQLVMVVDRAHLRVHSHRATVRHARADEANAVAEGSAAMVQQELALDPRGGAPDFKAPIRQMIDRKLWWVGVADGRLCFFCNIGPWCEQTVQLQGIWTPPALRGRGLASASLGAICDRLLDVSPTVSLYVNDFNEPALALYRRVGFERIGDLQTILF